MLKKEKKYEFRKRLLNIHKKNIRNHSYAPENDELVIENGFNILLPKAYTDVMITAAKDFVDYMFTSMNVAVSFLSVSDDKGETCNSAVCRIFPEQKEDYIIKINDYIEISAKNDRGLAQALYCLEDRMSLRKAPFLKKEEIKHTYLFSPRMVHSGYGFDQYPNEHLAAIAHAGMDAILVFVKGVNQTPAGFMDFNELIYRASRYGLDVYAAAFRPQPPGRDPYRRGKAVLRAA